MIRSVKLKFWAYGIVDKYGQCVADSDWCVDRMVLQCQVDDFNDDRSDEFAPYKVVRLYHKLASRPKRGK